MIRPECIACGLRSATYRKGPEKTYSGLACRICVQMKLWKWESAVDEWRRITGEER